MADIIQPHLACSLQEFNEAMEADQKSVPPAKMPDNMLTILASKWADAASVPPFVPFQCPAWRDYQSAVQKADIYATEIAKRRLSA